MGVVLALDSTALFRLCPSKDQTPFRGGGRTYPGLLEEVQEPQLLGPQDEEGVAFTVDASGRPAHAVDVLLQKTTGWLNATYGTTDVLRRSSTGLRGSAPTSYLSSEATF